MSAGTLMSCFLGTLVGSLFFVAVSLMAIAAELRRIRQHQADLNEVILMGVNLDSFIEDRTRCPALTDGAAS